MRSFGTGHDKNKLDMPLNQPSKLKRYKIKTNKTDRKKGNIYTCFTHETGGGGILSSSVHPQGWRLLDSCYLLETSFLQRCRTRGNEK